jgi:hypothetical protein
MQVTSLPDWDAHNCEMIAEEREVHVAEVQAPPMTRSSSRLKRAKLGQNVSKDSEPSTNTNAKGSSIPVESEKNGSSQPEVIIPESSTFNQFEIEPISSWIEKQLENQKIPPTILSTVIETHDNYPDGLLAIPSTKGGPPRIIVPLTAQENLVNQPHVDIHHQNHRKVHNLLYPLYWWPHMDLHSLSSRKNETRKDQIRI